MSAATAAARALRLSRTALLRAPQLRRTPQAAPTIRYFSVGARALEKKYTEDHEWIELSSDGKTATIGITTYAAKALGDVVYVELPTPDSQVEAGEACGAVESVKSASDILSPVSGQVVEANTKLEETPGLINKSPEGDAWVARIEIGEGAREAMGGLMDEGAYKAFVDE